ncbi:uncharacterized isomerase BH0283 isoform X2 [Eucalyptus grandis]|uniref:uncharacterized isomerase BH0283 isoform X1 n=1 Tax=Eucalyptus grandis TaxID=71139 RepID=UPI0005244332|nr:uncharacterized isomerase BH0283 isoform X1 [Eucalyptus grandis]XP_039166114.1 uncharacterized isomerase BH0283 isoform X2 [Eucalyptus grandis]
MAKKLVHYVVVDAFTETVFKGNPAAVCFLEEDEEKDVEWLQAVAREFNISITCFLARVAASGTEDSSPRFRLRWFTPITELNLCGHGTLAATHALITSGKVDSDTIQYVTSSGTLTAKRVSEIETGFFIELVFPVAPISECDSESASSLSRVFDGASIVEVKKTAKDDLLVVFSSGKAVEDLQPQFDNIRSCAGRGIIITGLAQPDSGFDYVNRFFSPKLGVNEDHVCGSANCFLAPYWSKKLRKNDFVVYAASPRGGVVNVCLDEQNQRVTLRGKAVTVMTGSILV